MNKTVTLAMTGASGMGYATRLLEVLLDGGHTVYLVYSQAAQFVAKQELNFALPARTAETRIMLLERYGCRPEQLHVFAREDWLGPIASRPRAGEGVGGSPCALGELAATP